MRRTTYDKKEFGGVATRTPADETRRGTTSAVERFGSNDPYEPSGAASVDRGRSRARARASRGEHRLLGGSRPGRAADESSPSRDATAKAEYYDPGFDDGDDRLRDELKAQQIAVALRDVSFNGTNFTLNGPYASVEDFDPPFNELFAQSTSDFDFDRNAAGFEAVNACFHIGTMMRYVNVDLNISVGPTLYEGGVKYDPSASNGDLLRHFSATASVW